MEKMVRMKVAMVVKFDYSNMWSRRSSEEELTDARSKGDRPIALSTALVTVTP